MKTTKLLIAALLFSIAYSGYGQVTLSDEENIALAKNDILETAALNENNAPVNLIPSEPATPMSLLSDLDDDGMDDDWEMNNGLDPSNPKDAWWDADNDHILNLFEYQLETNPNNDGSPTVSELTPADGETAIKDLIEASEDGIQVIRLTEGEYDASILTIFENNFKFMIQGGWNADFTEHDPELYPSNWTASSGEGLNVLIPLSNETITYSAVVLDGINFKALDGFSLYGAATFNISSGKSAISIYNCNMNNSAYYGIGLFHKRQTEPSDVFIVNTVIGNNLTGGIYTQVTDEVFARWRFINATINNPDGLEGGIDGLTADLAQLRIGLTNTINWGNDSFAFNFFSFHDVKIFTTYSNVDESQQFIDITDLGNTINVDPLFQNVAENDWSLAEGSPCIDTGIDSGLSFSGMAPEMGAIETIVISDVTEAMALGNINSFPNPFTDFIVIEMDELIGEEVEINIYDVVGKVLHSEKRTIYGNIEIETRQLPKGMLILNLNVGQKQFSTKLFKQ